MGLWNTFTGSDSKGQKGNNTGGHNIQKSNVLRPTDGQAFSPENPGNFGTVRSIPVIQNPRYFTVEEAQAIEKFRDQRKEQLAATKRAYKAVTEVDGYDVEVQVTHNKYAEKIAGNEVKKLTSNAAYAKKLHALRPAYARLSAELDKAEVQMDRRVGEIYSEIQATWGEY
jgi:hypothetical protein